MLAASFAPPPGMSPCPGYLPGDRLPVLRTKDARDAVLVCHGGYMALVSRRTRDPVWSAEHLSRASLTAAATLRRHGTFQVDPALATGPRADPDDYRRTGWDRGHMSPDADMPTITDRASSFEMGNVVPQAPRLNRVEWARIERHVRAMAMKSGDAYIITGPGFAGPPHGLGRDGVLVPATTWKVYYEPATGRGEAWACTNVQADVCRVIPIEEADRMVGGSLIPLRSRSWAEAPSREP